MGSMLDHGSQPPTADPCASVIARRTESGIRSGSGEVEEDGFVVVKRDAYAKGDSDQTKDETVRVIAAEIVDNLVDKAVAQAVAVAETRELDLNVRGGLAVSAEGTSSIDSNGTSNSNGARAEVRQLGANVGSAVAIHPINSTVSPLEHNPAIPTLSEYMQLDESEGIMNQQPSLSDESDAHINTTTSASISMTQQDTVSDAIKSTDIMNLIYRDLVVPDRPVATHTTSHPAHQITSSDSLSVIDENSSTPAAGGQGPSSLDVSPQSANASVTKQRKRTLIQDDSDDENQEQEIISAEGGGGTGGPNNGATKATTSPTFIRPPPTELAKLNEKFEHTSRLLTRVRPVTRNSSVAPATTVPPTPEQSTAQRPVPPNPPLTFLAPPLSSLALSAVTSQAPTTSPELVILSSASASPPLLTSSAPASLSSNILLPSVTAGSSSTPSPNEYPDRILQLTADDFRKLCQIITGLEDRNYRIADPALFQTFLLPELKALSNFVITRFKISPHNIPPPSNNSARAEWHQYAQALLFSSLHSYPVDYPLNVRNANSALASAIRSAAQDHVNRIQELGRVRMARASNSTPVVSSGVVTVTTRSSTRRTSSTSKPASATSSTPTASRAAAAVFANTLSANLSSAVTSAAKDSATSRKRARSPHRPATPAAPVPPSLAHLTPYQRLELLRFGAGVTAALPLAARVSCVWGQAANTAPLGARRVEFSLELSGASVSALVTEGGLWRDPGAKVYCMVGVAGGFVLAQGTTCVMAVCGRHFQYSCANYGTTRLDLTMHLKAVAGLLNAKVAEKGSVSVRFTLTMGHVVSKAMTVLTAVFVQRVVAPREMLGGLYERLAADNDVGDVVAKIDPFVSLGVEVAPSAPDIEVLQRSLIDIATSRAATATQTKSKAAANDDIETGDSTVSFTCPLTLVRIRHPAKGRNCRHRQVFDAENFLSFYSNKETWWKCIVCSEQIMSKDLVLDIDMMRLLAKYPTQDKCVMKSDGTDEPFGAPPPPLAVKATAAGNGVSIDEDGCVTPLATAGRKRAIDEVIVLDSDSDEEGETLAMEAAKRHSKTSPVGFTVVQVDGGDGEVGEVIVIDD